MVKYNKKGAVELSINLIIMLVIGLTVLGLIIAFVTGFLGDAQNSISGQVGADDQNKLNQVLNEEGNFVISPATQIVKKGDKEGAKLYMKIRNPSTGPYEPSATGNLVGIDGEFSLSITKGSTGDLMSQSDFTIFTAPIILETGEEEAYPIIVKTNSDIDTGTYYAKFGIEFIDGTKDTKIVTLNIQ
ncbi:MAG: hypothetical protein PF569_06400 [Candidatus Woesearchaeota archaeon]|jgi:hypothetical protein|nr:hypothetical protein [Candidatus Woesearchaeota archaeon]